MKRILLEENEWFKLWSAEFLSSSSMYIKEKGLENHTNKIASSLCCISFKIFPSTPRPCRSFSHFLLKISFFSLWQVPCGQFSPAHLAESAAVCLAAQGRTWNQLVEPLAPQNSSAGGKDGRVPLGGSEPNPLLVH